MIHSIFYGHTLPVAIGRLFCCSSRYCPRARFCVKNWSKPNSKYRTYSSRGKKRARVTKHTENWLRPRRICHPSHKEICQDSLDVAHVIRKHSIVHCCIERTCILQLLTVFFFETNGRLLKQKYSFILLKNN